MAVKFGVKNRYQPSASTGGDRLDLVDGEYPCQHRWSCREFEAGQGHKLRVAVRSTVEPNQVMWLSAGAADATTRDGTVVRHLRPSMDGETPCEEGPMLCGVGNPSAGTKAMDWLDDICTEAGIALDDTLEVLDKVPLKIKMKPNRHRLAKPGSMEPVLQGIGSFKTAPVSRSTAAGRGTAASEPSHEGAERGDGANGGAGVNGEPELTERQANGLATMLACLSETGTLAIGDRGKAMLDLQKFAPSKDPASRMLMASEALSEPVLTSGAFTFDKKAQVVSLTT